MNGVEGVGVWPIEELPDLFTKHTVGVHVIEKSAYDALNGELLRMAILQDKNAEAAREYFAELKQIQVERDALKASCDELVKALEDVSWLDGHGCVTGDCPHLKTTECYDHLILQLKSSGKHATEALAKFEERMKGLE